MALDKKEKAIELQGITKTFGSVVANDHINLEVRRGEILALLGENGSGKTTLMNMISGIYHPDEGTIKINGKEVTINSPIDAGKLGIGMIHQHFKLVDVFSAMDNVAMGMEGKRVKPKELKEKLTKLTEKYGLEVEPEKKIYNMSVSEKQTVEILPQETKKLFRILRKMKEQGSAIIIITHKLNEVMEISDRVTILRKGQSVETVNTSETNEKQLTELMVGRPVTLEIQRPQCENVFTRLKIVDLSVKAADGNMAVKDLNLEIKAGEILGVAGVAGSGQKELCESIAGLIPVQAGAILHNKENIVGKTPREIANLGISLGFVPEDRLGMGLVASMGMVDNILLKTYDKTKGIFIDRKPARKMAEDLVEKLGVVTPSVDTPVRLMSGGNVQKVLLGREIESNPSVLVTAYPVRGLDINSSYTIYDLLNEQKKKGVAVLFIGEDLDVLLQISDRIMVMCHGEAIGVVDAKSTTKEELGLMMAGKKKGDA